MEGDGLRSLWEIRLSVVPTIVRFRNGPTTTWQGVTWNSHGCSLAGEAYNADDEVARPSLTIANPENMYGAFAEAGYFDMALVVRKQVLQDHLDRDIPMWQQNIWLCGRVAAVNDQIIQLELRSPYDLPKWKTPARKFMPPDYPFVTI
jgi:phage-related protein